MQDSTLDEPNDLLRLCYRYKVQKIPISEDDAIRGAVLKQDLVRYLSRSENFDLELTDTINRLLEPVDDSFLESLREDLRSGSITGIPVVSTEGKLLKTITPGVLKAEEDSREFLEHSDQLAFYEDLLDQFPYPIEVVSSGDVVFRNQARETDRDGEGWVTRTIEFSDHEVIIQVPRIVNLAFEAFSDLETGESIDIRDLLDKIEVEYLKKAHRLRDSISAAAELVGLPRQTFNYRWNNKVDSSQES